MPPKILLRLGVSFLLITVAAYFFAGRWLNSRIFAPLNYPVSLDARHLKSPAFEINLKETYFVSLDLDSSEDDWYQDNRCNYRTILYPQWRVYKFGSASAESRELWVSSEQLTHTDGSLSYEFLASPGKYQLEWDIPAAAPCLNPRHPRLSISTDSSDYQASVALIQLLCVFLGGTGLALVVLAAAHAARLRLARTTTPRIFPSIVVRNGMPITKHATLRPIHDLPHWGLFFSTVFGPLIFVCMLYGMYGPREYKGLYVSWRNREAVVWEKSPWSATVAVYVRTPARFFVNSEEVNRNDLRSKLMGQLGRRAGWSVYFEAEPDTLHIDAIYAIETIQACGGKVIWITPKMREEERHKPQGTS